MNKRYPYKNATQMITNILVRCKHDKKTETEVVDKYITA